MSSFHNTQPRTREERLAAQSKEALEKGRLKTRPRHGPQPDTGSPLVPDPTSPMYEPNTFQRDVAGLIKQQKLQNMDKQQVRWCWQPCCACLRLLGLHSSRSRNNACALSCCVAVRSCVPLIALSCCGLLSIGLQHVYERKRQEAAVRESMRWEQMQALQQSEAERWQHVREAGLKGRQNKSSEHYNIISLEYHPTREGEKLRYKVGAGQWEPQHTVQLGLSYHCC